MPETITQIIHQFIQDRFMQSSIHDVLKNAKQSHLFELIGSPGSGKTFLIDPMIESLKDNYKTIIRYSPHPFWDNHLVDLLKNLTTLSEKEIEEICFKHDRDLISGNKYDFFYYLSDKITQKDALKSCLFIIDDCDILDQYSRDFLQYIVQYAEDSCIQIIALSHKKLFPFSDVEYLHPLGIENIEFLIQKSFPDSHIAYAKDSEILKNISEGNLLIIKTILTDMSKVKTKNFDVSNYISKHYNTEDIYLNSLNEISETQKKLLIFIFLLDGFSNLESLKKVYGSKTISQDLEKLKKADLIYQIEDNWLIHKKLSFSSWMKGLDSEKLESVFLKALDYSAKINCCIQLRTKIHQYIKSYDTDLFKEALRELNKLIDNDSLLVMNQYILPFQAEPNEMLNVTKNIGITYSNLNQKDKAVEYFRQCLQLCTTHKLPAEEIIFLLASNLFAINSSNFALEVIKKYSPTTIEPIWKSKILLQKAEILTETEQFEEGLNILDEVFHSMSNIEDKKTRYKIQGDAKKIKGRIHYYINEYEQAESVFKEAETMYNLATNFNGLAAVYNNLGVLYMFQGEWEKSEQFFIKSLNLEKENYNLNGISVCYNNLGGLMDDKGDREKSLYYLEEALKNPEITE